jgi:hypothetical protein
MSVTRSPFPGLLVLEFGFKVCDFEIWFCTPDSYVFDCSGFLLSQILYTTQI